jgi:hypothetical protein
VPEELAGQQLFGTRPVARWLTPVGDRTVPALEFQWCSPPTSVPLLSGRLYSQYVVRDGRLRVAGFTRTLRPLLIVLGPPGDQGVEVVAILDPDNRGLGGPLRDLILRELEQVQPDPLRQWSVGWDDANAQLPQPPAERQAAWQNQLSSALTGHPEWLESMSGLLVLPVEWIEGKLCFEIGDQAVASEFGQWSPVLFWNPGLCPPYCCPLSGQCGKDLAADQEGDISLTQQLETCQLTGKRLHDFKLVTCANSGQRLSRSLALASATTPDWLSPNHASLCRQCGLAVPRRAQRLGRCIACRSLQAIRYWEAAQQVECQWLLSPVINRWGYTFDQLRKIQVFRNDRFTWLAFDVNRQGHMMVFDTAGQQITHHVRRPWRWQWQALDFSAAPQPH